MEPCRAAGSPEVSPDTPGGSAALSAGWSNTCALQSSEGGIRCWGLNDGGQLGDGTRRDSPSPVEPEGLGTGRISVAVGGGHACALSATGGVKCWGRNDRGQLGNGTTADLNTPVDVAGLPEQIAAIALGKAHTCVLTIRGGVKCWGANESGQLGDGTTADRGKPVDVLGLTAGVSAIAAGASHTCALGINGALKCWGSNRYGQLGDASLENRSAPVDVSGLAAGVDSIAAGGSHTCAIASGVKLMCWGWNAYGQLGDSTPTDRNEPVEVKWLAGTAALRRGRRRFHLCDPANRISAMLGEQRIRPARRWNHNGPPYTDQRPGTQIQGIDSRHGILHHLRGDRR